MILNVKNIFKFSVQTYFHTCLHMFYTVHRAVSSVTMEAQFGFPVSTMYKKHLTHSFEHEMIFVSP